MFGSFMPMFGGGRSKASSLSGRPDESQGGFGKFARGFGEGFGQSRGDVNPGGQSMPPQAFGQGRALGPMGNFGQMMGGMFSGRIGQPGQRFETGFNPQFNPQFMPPGRNFNPTPAVQQLPQNPYGGAVPGDLSNAPGRIGEMYRNGQIQTFGGPRAMGPISQLF